jgi:hypothetical protein
MGACPHKPPLFIIWGHSLAQPFLKVVLKVVKNKYLKIENKIVYEHY